MVAANGSSSIALWKHYILDWKLNSRNCHVGCKLITDLVLVHLPLVVYKFEIKHVSGGVKLHLILHRDTGNSPKTDCAEGDAMLETT